MPTSVEMSLSLTSSSKRWRITTWARYKFSTNSQIDKLSINCWQYLGSDLSFQESLPKCLPLSICHLVLVSEGPTASCSVRVNTCRIAGSCGKKCFGCLASSVSQGTYPLLDLPYTCRLSEDDTAVLVVASSVLLLLGDTWNVMWTICGCPCERHVDAFLWTPFPPQKSV